MPPDIKVLTGLEPYRLRPQMYIGPPEKNPIINMNFIKSLCCLLVNPLKKGDIRTIFFQKVIYHGFDRIGYALQAYGKMDHTVNPKHKDFRLDIEDHLEVIHSCQHEKKDKDIQDEYCRIPYPLIIAFSDWFNIDSNQNYSVKIDYVKGKRNDTFRSINPDNDELVTRFACYPDPKFWGNVDIPMDNIRDDMENLIKLSPYHVWLHVSEKFVNPTS